MITQEIVKELFDYVPETGDLVWKKLNKNARSIQVGDVAGSINHDGYKHIRINKKLYSTHRLVFLYHYGYLPKFIDHINQDPSNNCIENLRVCTLSQNSMNRGNRSDNKVGLKGVCWSKPAGKWRAYIYLQKKQINLGCFLDPIDAAVAYNLAAEQHFGQFACLNGPENNKAWEIF